MAKKPKELKRIPYNVWAYNQLSVAKYYGGINIGEDYYEFDREVLKDMLEDEAQQKAKGITDGTLSKAYYPDLVLYSDSK